ncbi:MAG: ArsA family ATPase [Acidimicrobiales bacterium]
MTRILLFTGKGGVGKTTVAAATGLRCATAGQRTLVLSTDPAHSLGDAFGTPLDSTPLSVAPHLWAQQLDATERFEEVWGEVQAYLARVLDWAGVDGIEAEELSVIPGLDEIFALSDIVDHATSGTWDVLVVDCAPTAETIRLLSLPDVLRWYMERVFPVSRKVTRLVKPIMSRVSGIPVADDNVFKATAAFYERMGSVRSLLTDGDHATVRLVVNPERLVVAETRRTATYLSLYGYRLDAVVANRLFPEEVSDPWFKAWKETHAEHLATIGAGFAPVPVLRATLASDELVGLAALDEFGAEVYAGLDPAAILHRDEPLRVEPDEDGYVLRIALPFAARDDLEVGRNGDELLVRVGPHRRSIVLPDALGRRAVLGASLDDGSLAVRFGAAASAVAAGGAI